MRARSMYVESKGESLQGRARPGRLTFTKSGKGIHYVFPIAEIPPTRLPARVTLIRASYEWRVVRTERHFDEMATTRSGGIHLASWPTRKAHVRTVSYC
jgi:hypothetical protein